jgi:hypothetical protein
VATQEEELTMRVPKILAVTMMFAALALFVGSKAFTVNVSAQKATEICDNGKDDDGDGLIDSADPDCKKTSTGCSPGFYKNHTSLWVGTCCTDETDPTCDELLNALVCKGSDSSCGRSDAAAFLDACTGCSE